MDIYGELLYTKIYWGVQRKTRAQLGNTRGNELNVKKGRPADVGHQFSIWRMEILQVWKYYKIRVIGDLYGYSYNKAYFLGINMGYSYNKAYFLGINMGYYYNKAYVLGINMGYFYNKV